MYLLESIEIPNTVTEICHGAVGWCGKLKEINIPKSVTTIESNFVILLSAKTFS